jgi:hypothetical protein
MSGALFSKLEQIAREVHTHTCTHKPYITYNPILSTLTYYLLLLLITLYFLLLLHPIPISITYLGAGQPASLRGGASHTLWRLLPATACAR